MAAPTSSSSVVKLPEFITNIFNNVSSKLEALSNRISGVISPKEAKVFAAGTLTGSGLTLLSSAKLSGTAAASNPVVLGVFLTLAGLAIAYYALKGRVDPVSSSGSVSSKAPAASSPSSSSSSSKIKSSDDI